MPKPKPGTEEPVTSKPAPKRRMVPGKKPGSLQRHKGDATRAIEAAGGIDWVCEQIEADLSYRDIAETAGVKIPTLRYWLEADPARSARARAARTQSAAECDQKALEVLKNAERDQIEMTRAREIAQHYRWRAKVRDPRRYGDKLAVDATLNVGEMDLGALAAEALSLLRAVKPND